MKKRLIGIILAGVLLVGVVAAVIVPKMSASAGTASEPLKVVTGVIGSEKKEFFDDPRVKAVFAARGYDVRVKTAGSRQIATSPALATSDFAFPSSAPAADKIAIGRTVKGTYSPFFSPMAVATFKPVAQLLKNAGIARQDSKGTWTLDMKAYLNAVKEGKRWNQLPGAAELYNSNRSVLMTSTDIRSSNSAAMYLAIASYTANGNNVLSGSFSGDTVLPEMAGLFLNQGFSEASSGGPFGDYLSQGMGSKPMVMIYESQFLGQQMSETGSKAMSPDMVLMYPQATVLSKHTVIALTDSGSAIGQLLLSDPDLMTLEAQHGFRPADRSKLENALQEHNLPLPEPLVDVADAPTYEVLESLIDKISAKYDPANTPAPTADGDAVTKK
ncbi:hypothetical protein [Arthrobacter sp. UYCo732]|uniref:hypothetical protein n=1 Tax=Arthrobacter sp. UYCo732 TaxID=3156336 RepID=UPI00339B336B